MHPNGDSAYIDPGKPAAEPVIIGVLNDVQKRR
jgi:hypothetical protein